MDWGNCIMHEVAKGADGRVTGVAAALHLEGDFKKTKLKLTWLADVADLVPLRVVTLGDLITKAKVRHRGYSWVYSDRTTVAAQNSMLRCCKH